MRPMHFGLGQFDNEAYRLESIQCTGPRGFAISGMVWRILKDRNARLAQRLSVVTI